MIELSDIHLQFDPKSRPLLKGVSLRVQKGEAWALIGPSGHGKSTLLKLIAGLITPQGGRLHIDGKTRNEMTQAELDHLSRRMSMLFQKNALFDSLTVSENVAFPLREIAQKSEDEIAKSVQYYLEAVGIWHAKDLFPDEISGGMQKRLGIARALALKPEILLYDDPTAGLDPITSRKIIQLIIELQKEYQSTIIVITNEMSRAFQLQGKIAMVVDGELICTGSANETLEHSDPRVHQFVRGKLEGPLMVTT